MVTVLLLLALAFSGGSGRDSAPPRLERVRAQAAAELAEFYCGGDNWYRCWRVLQRLERLEQREGG